jgi:hypothetical protein
MLVPVGHEALDLATQVCDRAKRAAADRPLGDQSEPALDLVELERVAGRVV